MVGSRDSMVFLLMGDGSRFEGIFKQPGVRTDTLRAYLSMNIHVAAPQCLSRDLSLSLRNSFLLS